LISDYECGDLERLLEDRHRCAHPSMNATDEVYLPSAELARAHLRNAVMHLLRHPPVQGKAALQKVIAEVKSAYFPATVDEVAIHLQRGPLGNPRESLVRNFVIVLLKGLCRDPMDDGSFRRHAAALNGTRRLHPALVEGVMREWITKLIRELHDDRWPFVVHLMSHVGDAWDCCDQDVRNKMVLVVEQLPEAALVKCLPTALELTPLRACALKRIEYTTPGELCELVDASPRAEYVRRAVDFYASANDESSANMYGARLIVPLTPFLAAPDIQRVFTCIPSNAAVRTSSVLGSVLRSIRSAGRVGPEEFRALLVTAGLDVEYSWLFDGEIGTDAASGEPTSDDPGRSDADESSDVE
jgi:hypothetical protein